MSRRNKTRTRSSSSSAPRLQHPPPTDHGVSLGTTMRQERALFDHELEKLDARRNLNRGEGHVNVGSDQRNGVEFMQNVAFILVLVMTLRL